MTASRRDRFWLSAGLAVLSGLCSLHAEEAGAPQQFGLYYSGPPCPAARVDRTFSTFQVNLDPDSELLVGRLGAGPDGRALLEGGGDRGVELLTNASRANWLLGYPLLDEGVGVWGRSILGPGCAVQEGAFYIEALFPLPLLTGPIEPRLDLMDWDGFEGLKEALHRYRRSLAKGVAPSPAGEAGAAAGSEADEAGIAVGAGSKLQKALYEDEAARCQRPWRVRLMGPADPLSDASTVDVLLSGADGSIGVFGHISVGNSSIVYNIYPIGSDRGAPDYVPLWDYLFNAERGHAIRRPTWLLRLQGVPPDAVAAFDGDMRTAIKDIQDGRAPYHPTSNNCTTASLKALRRLGFKVAPTRYFTRRFPRLAFGALLDDLPGLVRSGRLPIARVELIYIPQVPVRPNEGKAPNRPLKDRSKVG